MRHEKGGVGGEPEWSKAWLKRPRGTEVPRPSCRYRYGGVDSQSTAAAVTRRDWLGPRKREVERSGGRRG